MALTEFKKVAAKAHAKKEKVAFCLLKLKVTTRGIKALAEEKKEKRLKDLEELLNIVEKITLSIEKGKAKKTTKEYCEEFEKEMEDSSHLVEEVMKPPKRRKMIVKRKMLNDQVNKR
ncbi:protein MNN4-like [Cucumis melo var. makuwa]|uniref:Protein MNN4-like n=1 Tax=Cucumis melo var. makuwa TaxID=1194695 RepID=A0A5A7TQG2_CUCMM|nr:protein MNN4-like [Cucumis melo var. makuwa]